MQKTKSIGVAKVFKLQARRGKYLLHRIDKLFDEFIEGGAAFPRLGEANVQRIIEQRLVISPSIEHDGEASGGGHARAGGVEGKLPDRNPHAIGAQIAETQNALAVGYYDHANVRLRPILQDLFYFPPIFDGNIKSPGPAKN